jgi:hypothetical protein
MKIKKSFLVIAGIIVLLTAFVIVRFIVGGGEDNWIKDSRGVYVKQGNPSLEPIEIIEQQQAISCALEKFNNFTGEKNSQCLGACGNYAVDIVHVPRTAADDLTENQCRDYADGKIPSFIELDKNGEIVRIG